MTDWNAQRKPAADIGDAEVLFKIDATGEVDAMVNVQVVDEDGNEVERRYARGKDEVDALLTQGQRTVIAAILDRVRDKGREDLIP